jgi:hypothetical protein
MPLSAEQIIGFINETAAWRFHHRQFKHRYAPLIGCKDDMYLSTGFIIESARKPALPHGRRWPGDREAMQPFLLSDRIKPPLLLWQRLWSRKR